MVRELASAMALGVVLTGAAAAQQSVGVSAVILERVEADVVQVEVRSAGGRLHVEQTEYLELHEGTRLLRSTYVNAGEVAGAAETTVPVSVRSAGAGTMRLERRVVRSGAPVGERVHPGESLLLAPATQLTLTRVIASNS